MDAAPDQPLATTGTQARGFSQRRARPGSEIIAAAKAPCRSGVCGKSSKQSRRNLISIETACGQGGLGHRDIKLTCNGVPAT